MTDQIRYRPEIDGLRAIAVLSVIIYHLCPNILPGGFVGVDVFFVISGYLITSLIQKDVSQRTFSFQQFYTKRIRRIAPAFYLVVAVTLIAGGVFLFPDAYQELARSSIDANIFIANRFFAHRYDYFSQNIWELPLAHLWSLSVEEQYYIGLPVFLLAAQRLRIQTRQLQIILALSICVSVIIAEYELSTPTLAREAYYLLSTRGCGLWLGSLIALGGFEDISFANKLQKIAPVLGLSLILLCAFFTAGESRYPGIRCLFPCLGAALIVVPWNQTGRTWNSLLNRNFFVCLDFLEVG